VGLQLLQAEEHHRRNRGKSPAAGDVWLWVAIAILCVVYYVSFAFGLATSLTTTASIIVVTICPFILIIFLLGLWAWWLALILNAVLYGGLAFWIAQRRLVYKRAHQISK